MKTLISFFLGQLKDEAVTTRKMLQIVPAEKYDWQPHPKSMSLVRLATHVAEIPGWIKMVIDQDVLDFAEGNNQPEVINSNEELMNYFEKNLASGLGALEKSSDEILPSKWVMKSGEQVFLESNKGEMLRHCMSQLIHHRAQLGVYLRLLNIPIPGSYGPSADEMEMYEASGTSAN